MCMVRISLTRVQSIVFCTVFQDRHILYKYACSHLIDRVSTYKREKNRFFHNTRGFCSKSNFVRFLLFNGSLCVCVLLRMQGASYILLYGRGVHDFLEEHVPCCLLQNHIFITSSSSVSVPIIRQISYHR